MKVTKPMLMGLASLWALAAYLVHPILLVMVVMLVVAASSN